MIYEAEKTLDELFSLYNEAKTQIENDEDENCFQAFVFDLKSVIHSDVIAHLVDWEEYSNSLLDQKLAERKQMQCNKAEELLEDIRTIATDNVAIPDFQKIDNLFGRFFKIVEKI